MLRILKIHNLAVIDRAELELDQGLICLTGESGAGKSVMIDALLLLSGQRASSDLVRSGCEKAWVEAEFELASLPDEHDEGWELLEGEQLFLRRELTKDGKSRAFVNGAMVPNGVLARYGALAFEIHGQHGQQKLLREKQHLTMFDDQTALKATRLAVESQTKAFQRGWEDYWALRDSQAERLKEMDFLQMQVDEIDAVDPEEGDHHLDLALKKARNHRLITTLKHQIGDTIDQRLRPDFTTLKSQLDQLREFEPGLSAYLEQLESLSATLEDLSVELSDVDQFEDEQELSRLENRESELNRLFMKYGTTVDEVIAERERLTTTLAAKQTESEGLTGRLAALRKEYRALGTARKALEKARENKRGEFERKVTTSLKRLALPHAHFAVISQWETWPRSLPDSRELRLPQGQVAFHFSANPGEPPKPLTKVASGGELSRLLLALINASDREAGLLLVFDEIDAGLGGETAKSIGEELAALGTQHQVLCVTHFAQVARFASQQIKIEKIHHQGSSVTQLVVCDFEERVSELARLMAGDADSAQLRDHARALINGAPS